MNNSRTIISIARKVSRNPVLALSVILRATLLVALLTVMGSQLCEAGTRTVNNHLDDGSDGTLRREIALAGEGDRILISTNTQIELTAGEIRISTNLQIDVQSISQASISTLNGSRIFRISRSTVTFANLMLRDADSGDNGGSILVFDGKVLFTHCTLHNNRGEGGGAIFIDDGNVTLAHCTVSSNSSSEDGGAIYLETGKLNIQNSVLTGNQTTSANGGALFVQSGDATIANTTVAHCSANNGGAIYADEKTILNLTSSTIEHCTSSGDGGAIYLQNDSDDDDINLQINCCKFDSNSAGQNGGALYSEGAADVQITISNSLWMNNSCGADGGAIQTQSEGYCHITQSTFTSNHSDGDGGAISTGESSSPAMQLINCTLFNNQADGDGGAMFCPLAETVFVSSSTIHVNTCDADMNGNGSGGGIHAEALYISSSIVAGNSDTGDELPDISGEIISEGNNLIGNVGDLDWIENTAGDRYGDPRGTTSPDRQAFESSSNIDAMLGAFADYGGKTPSLALKPASSAIDNSKLAGAGFLDQRGVVRTGLSDIGAFEFSSAASLRVSAISPGATLESGQPVNICFEAVDINGNPAIVATNTTVQLTWNTSNLTLLQGSSEAVIEHSATKTTVRIGNLSGAALSTRFSLTVVSGQSLIATSLTLTLGANQTPQITASTTVVAAIEDISTTLSITIGDTESATGSLLLSATSDNQTLLPDANIVQFGATAATSQFTANLAANQFGSVNVTISVNDGVTSSTTTITINVQAVNDAPQISTLTSAVFMDEDSATSINISISDIDNPVASLWVSATSADQSILSDAAIVQQGATSASLSFLLTPEPNTFGTVQVFLTVRDQDNLSSVTSVMVAVANVNDPPTMTTIADLVITDASVHVRTFTLVDIDDAPGTLFVNATSSNQDILFDFGINIFSSGNTVSLFISPECTEGTVEVSVDASDSGSLTTSASFTLTVINPPALDISGATSACAGGVFTYTATPPIASANNFWAVTGGTIIGSQTSASVNVSWNHQTSGAGICELTLARIYDTGCFTSTTLIVQPQPFQAVLDFTTATSTAALVIPVLLNDLGDALIVDSVTAASGGTVIVTNNSLVYTPDGVFSGSEFLTYTISNPQGCSSTGAIVIAVEGSAESVNIEYITRYKDRKSGIRGLRRAVATAVSPDGKHVYAAGRSDHSIAIFSRENSDGELTYLKRVRNRRNGVTGLKYVSDIVCSPNGRFVFAVGYGDDALVAFERNPASGDLQFLDRLKQGQNNLSTVVDGMRRPRALALSPDGRNIYVASFSNNALAVFSFNDLSKQLEFREHHVDGIGSDGLRRAVCVAVSPDGRNVFVAGSGDNALAVFDRNVIDGSLGFNADYRDAQAGIDGLAGAAAVALSPDGSSVYVAGMQDDAIALFSRLPQSGALTFIDLVKDGGNGVDGLNGVADLSVSPDGSHLWSAGSVDNALAVFKRNPESGELNYREQKRDGHDGVDGLRAAQNITISPDSRHIYCAAPLDNAVSVFFRNRSPEAVADLAGAAAKNTILEIDVLDNDSDPDQHSLDFVSTTDGTLGTVRTTRLGRIEYSAGATTGADEFTYTIEDGHGGSSTATVIVQVVNAKAGSGLSPTLSMYTENGLSLSPNPAQKNTLLSFRLEKGASVRLTVTDMRGVKQRSIELGSLPAGENIQTLELLSDSGSGLPAGTYMVELSLQTGDTAEQTINSQLIIR